MIIIEQLRVGGFDDNFSYLLFEPRSGAAALVDPCGDIETIKQAFTAHPDLKPNHILLTHGHPDHTSGVGKAREFFPAPIVASPQCGFPHDIEADDGRELRLGDAVIECLAAPGHTADSVLYKVGDEALFTGDTLFIDWCGYCEPNTMFRTMRQVIWPLPDNLKVYSGHDYGRDPVSTLGVEKRRNPYLAAADMAEFQTALKNL